MMSRSRSKVVILALASLLTLLVAAGYVWKRGQRLELLERLPSAVELDSGQALLIETIQSLRDDLPLFGDPSDTLASIAKTYHTNGWHGEAEQVYSMIWDRTSDLKSLYLLADSRQLRMDFPGYFEALSELERNGSDYPPALLALGSQELRKRNFDEAQRLLLQAFQREANARPVVDALKRLERLSGSEAVSAALMAVPDSLVDKIPDPWLDEIYVHSFDVGQLIVRADSSALREDFELGLQLLERAAKLDPSDWKVHVMRVNLLGKMARIEEAVNSYRLAVRHGAHEAAALGELSSILRQGGDYERLLELADRAIERSPDFAELYQIRAQAFRGLNSLPRAEANLQRALRMMPESVEIKRDLAELLWDRGKFSLAVNYFLQIARRLPLDTKSRTYLAQYYIEQNRLGQAEPFVREAIALDSNNAELKRLARGYFIQFSQLSASRGNWGDVERLLRSAEEISELSLVESKLLAQALSSGGKASEAIEVLQSLAKGAGQLPEIHISLAGLLEQEGRSGEAAQNYRQAISLSQGRAAYDRLREAALARLAVLEQKEPTW